MSWPVSAHGGSWWLGTEELGDSCLGSEGRMPSPRAATEAPNGVLVASTSSSGAVPPGSLHFPLKTSCPEGRSPQRGGRKTQVNDYTETTGGLGQATQLSEVQLALWVPQGQVESEQTCGFPGYMQGLQPYLCCGRALVSDVEARQLVDWPHAPDRTLQPWQQPSAGKWD